MQFIQVVGDIGLREYSCLLQVTVGDVTSCVLDGYHALLYVIRKGHVPHDRVFSFSKQHSSHAYLCSVHCPYDQWVIGHYLSKASRSLSHAMGKHLEVHEVVSEVRCDPYVVLLGNESG